MNNFLTFKFSADDWTPSNRYCNREYCYYDLPTTNFVLYPELKGNCTCGVTIQVAEQYDKKIRLADTGRMGNANTWWNHSGLKNNWLNDWKEVDIPVPGSVICMDGWFTSSGENCGGHVQFIYDVDIQNNKILIGESLYRSKKYQTRWISMPQKGEEVFLFNGYRFVCQGYLNPPYSIDRRVKRDISKNQVSINVDQLRVRKSPAGELYFGNYFLPGIYNVLCTEEADGLTWAKLADDIWVGLDPRYTEYYKADEETDYKTLYFELLKENEELKARIKKAKEALDGNI